VVKKSLFFFFVHPMPDIQGQHLSENTKNFWSHLTVGNRNIYRGAKWYKSFFTFSKASKQEISKQIRVRFWFEHFNFCTTTS